EGFTLAVGDYFFGKEKKVSLETRKLRGKKGTHREKRPGGYLKKKHTAPRETPRIENSVFEKRSQHHP
ncbi:hypothetical protein ACQ7BU_04050, partial [Escherichia coli]|uniref:hypothetical protein n=1 Tax=Escherichia coli TaxID=562 RepID=UPI003D3518F5